ncbi:TRMT2A [Lepeophtheirus salmonis]|uniref:TRMT2A n=1 Tax=Lepeophtheirus salmonis TaxID=72036 RepID=A0A7R8D2E6_LEPSM|nr:TRMT2A [Lepeophtheirus salmonis]CAF2956339.1 TRMT2A [Lepeophtheirus salmonis]
MTDGPHHAGIIASSPKCSRALKRTIKKTPTLKAPVVGSKTLKNSISHDKSSPFDESKPLFKGKILARPSIDFGKFDPEWINRAASTPVKKTNNESSGTKQVFIKDQNKNLNSVGHVLNSLKNASSIEDLLPPLKVNEPLPPAVEKVINDKEKSSLAPTPAIPSPPDSVVKKETPSPTSPRDVVLETSNNNSTSACGNDYSGSDIKTELNGGSTLLDPVASSQKKDVPPSNGDPVADVEKLVDASCDSILSESTSRPPKRSSDKKIENNNIKQPKVDSLGVVVEFMNPHWHGGGFPRPFPPPASPYYHVIPPQAPSEVIKPFHIPPPSVPALDKVIKNRFSVPPPAVSKKEAKSKHINCPAEDLPFNKDFKKTNQRENAPPSELVQDLVTSLWKTPYDKQLKIKEDEVLAYMNKLKTDTLNANRALHSWTHYVLDIEIDVILRLASIKRVNNLTIGYQIEPETYYVGPIDSLKNIPQRIKYVTKKVRLRLKEYFETGDGSLCELNSLYFNEKTLEGSGTFELISGVDHISEKICEQYFRLSPRIPFCLNTTAIETVFKVMIDVCGLDFETTLVDLCCGGGTVGLSLSKYVGQWRALSPCLLNRANFSNIVLVVDPPQIPFDSKVICNIRKCSNINRVVWLVSDSKAATRSFEDLVRPPSNQYKGDPFIPVEVIPVDTFPHTFQFTMVIILMRGYNSSSSHPIESDSSSLTANNTTISVSSHPFSDYPAPDLSWKKVETPPVI